MTGIERLREFVGARDEWGLGGALAEIADEIERERDAEVADSPYDAILPEDREAISWVRKHGGLDHVKSEWRSRVPYDLYERRRQRLLGHIAECETALGRRNQRIEDLLDALDRRLMPEGYEWPRYEDGEPVRIGDVVSDVEVRSVVFRDGGILLSDCTSVPGWGTWRSYKEPIKRPAVLAADGEPLEVGQTVYHTDTGREYQIHSINDDGKGAFVYNNSLGQDASGLHLCSVGNLTHQRPVLDADGVEVEVGDDLYTVGGMFKFHVSAIDKKSGRIATEAMFALDKWADPKMLTHRAPVLAGDGRPLREGETVWLSERGFKSKLVDRGEPLKVVAFDKNGSVGVLDRDGIALGETSPWWFNPSCLTHERPESKCRDCAHWQKDPTADNMGVCWFLYHEYEGQDCYSARLSDIGACEEFMPSARALAERERGE